MLAFLALCRSFATKHHKAQNIVIISVLLDLSNFYDRIDREASSPVWTRRGILAGDPLVAKVYLQRAMEALRRRFPMLHVDLWIDDCSFDVVERLPGRASLAVRAFHFCQWMAWSFPLAIQRPKGCSRMPCLRTVRRRHAGFGM